MPRYEELRLNQNGKSNTYRSRGRLDKSGNSLVIPLVFAVFVIIVFAIIFSIVKTYGQSVSIAVKDFFRIPQPEAIFSEAVATVIETEDVSFLNSIPGFRFFVPSGDDESIEVIAEETDQKIEVSVKDESISMFENFTNTSRITREALAPFFNNTFTPQNNNTDSQVLGSTNTIDVVNNDTRNQNAAYNDGDSSIVEATTFDDVLKPRTEVYSGSKMKPAYTRRYTVSETNTNVVIVETNTYSSPIIEKRKQFVEYTEEKLESNRKEFYNIDDEKEVAYVREITEAPKGRVNTSTSSVKKDREVVNISENVPAKKDTQNVERVRSIKNIERESVAEISNDKASIIVPSPIPVSVRNNTYNERTITSGDDILLEEDTQNVERVRSIKNIERENVAEISNDKVSIIVPSPIPESMRNNIYSNGDNEDETLDIENTAILPDSIPSLQVNNNILRENNEVLTNTKTNNLNNNQNEIFIDNIYTNSLGISENNDTILENNQTIIRNNSDFRYTATNDNYYTNYNTGISEEPQRFLGDTESYENDTVNPGIFLVEYDETEGTITLVFKEREIDTQSFTLEKAILTLLEGATDKENGENIISCIPHSTRLLDIFRENNTVYLNFSSNFEFNPIGDEGMLVQLYQLVYTATQFDGIDNVVFLIEGKYNEFIGAEGSIANMPFTRLTRDNTTIINMSK